MKQSLFENKQILEWLHYYAGSVNIDLAKVKLLDITGQNKNLIPTVESNKMTLVFTEAGHTDLFYEMWNVGLGECDVWYNVGSEPTGEILHSKLKDMIDRGINASAAMLIRNPKARSTYKVGMRNSNFSRGSVHYVGSEIRAVIMNKLHIASDDTVCIISGESIAVESALLAEEGQIIAVEYDRNDRQTMEDNIEQFGLKNITVIDHVDEESMKDLPVPTITMLVASASMEQEIDCLLKLNPDMEFVIYTLDFMCAASIPAMFEARGLTDVDAIQISVSRLSPKNVFEAEPAPWLITGQKPQKQ